MGQDKCIVSSWFNEGFKWVLVSSIGKVSDGYIRDMGFNSRLHQKLIGILVW